VVQYFEEAGIVGINIEDQLMPKRCGHMRGKELTEPQEMAKKIDAACMAKRDPTSSSTPAPTPWRSRASTRRSSGSGST
jgi:2-methylisocitrate lyase-like PEP mutase family enzyme